MFTNPLWVIGKWCKCFRWKLKIWFEYWTKMTPHLSIVLSLSLSLYIYIYIYTQVKKLRCHIYTFLHYCFGLVWFGGFYGISTFVGYLMPNPFLCKLSLLFKTIQFSIITQFNFQKHFYFKLFKQLYITIQFSVNTVFMSKNSSIWNNSVKQFNVSTV